MKRYPLAAFVANLAALGVSVASQREIAGTWAPAAWAGTAVLGLVLWRINRPFETERSTTGTGSARSPWRAMLLIGVAALVFGLRDLYLDLTSTRGALLWLGGLLATCTALAAPRIARPLPWSTRRLLAVAALVSAALFLRLYDLEGIPADVNNDEGEHADSGLNLMHGVALHPGYPNQLASPFQTGWQTEPTGGHWLLGAVMQVAGENVFGMRLTAALSGTACVWLLYLLLAEWVRPPVALAAAAMLAFGHVHLFWSRTGFLQATVAALSTAVVWLLSRGLRRGGGAAFVAAGMCLGLAQYVYWSARFLLVVLALFGVYLLILQRPLLRRRIAGIGLMATVFLLAVAPLAIWTIRNPGSLLARGNRVFVFTNTAYMDSMYPGQSVASALLSQLGKSLHGFAFAGDGSRAFYRAAAPLLDPLAGALVLMGLLGFTLQWRRPERVLVSLWLWVPLLVFCGFTIDPPPTQRLLFMFPALYVVAGVGLERMAAAAAAAGTVARRALATSIAALLVYAAWWNWNLFFVHYPVTWQAKTWTHIGRLLRDGGPSQRAYLLARPELYAYNSTIRFIARGVPATDLAIEQIPLQERDERDGVFVVSPAAAPEALPKLLEAYPRARVEEHRDAKEQWIFTAVYVAARELNAAAAATAPRRWPSQRIGIGGRGDGQFLRPRGVAVDKDGRVYVADTGNDRILVYAADGTPEAQLTAGGMLVGPWSIAVAGDGEVFVLERGSKRLRRLSRSDQIRMEIAAAPDGEPVAFAAAADGSIVVVDRQRGQLVVHPAGGGVPRRVGRAGSGPGEFRKPAAIAIDRDGSVYVSDPGNNRVQHLSPQLDYRNEWPIPPIEDNRVAALAAAPAGGVWVLYPGLGAAHLFSPDGEEQRAVGIENGDPDGLLFPGDIAVGESGDVFILDLSRPQVWRYAPG